MLLLTYFQIFKINILRTVNLRNIIMYKSLLQKLYQINVNHPVKLGLQNISEIYDKLGRPIDNIPIIHIGGTNGKGSVCLKTAKALQFSGIKTGLFVSPHISSFRERIQVNGQILDESDILVSIDRFKIV